MFDPSRGARTPKARFAYLFPSRTSAVIQVRLKDDAHRRRSAATRSSRSARPWRCRSGGSTRRSYTVTGAPVVLEDLADALAGSVLRLLVVALVVMALVLALVFRSRLRLVPLVVALAAVAVTFGAMALVGAPLTMASIAVLPVLLGLGVDYAIQFQARVEEEGGDAESRGRALAGPTIATAALATARRLPRAAALAGADGARLRRAAGGRHRVRAAARAHGRARRRSRSPRAARARRGARALAARRRRAGGRGARPRSRARRPAWAAPAAARAARRAAPAGAGAGASGSRWRASGWRSTRRPRSSPTSSSSSRRTCRPCATCRRCSARPAWRARSTSSSRARDLTDPKVVAWMRDYQSDLLKRFGYSASERLRQGRAVPGALAAPTSSATSGAAATREQVRALLDAVPPYFSQAVITQDRKTAKLAFGVRLMSLERQQEIFDEMRARLNPPAGRDGASSAGCRCWSPAPTTRCRDPLRRLRDAAGRPARGGARAARRLPALGARARAARADRAGHGLVGARAVRPAHPAQPDVGDAGRARDRDLDRVHACC